ncbi:unnamed protein product [Paramecium pentaurelia]|uniref:Ubiquitin-like domain-containing protein n=1 Tax=Paramecium pentaurelia TaxID=43138 RepID=A0A8S1T0I7_9CILI|nr:unnamed protein product [Paramecium pentaurelia]
MLRCDLSCKGEKNSHNEFIIWIENHENEREQIKVHLDETISEIKGKIFNGIEPKKSQIYHKRNKLQNQQTIRQCGLKENDKLYIIYGQNIKE